MNRIKELREALDLTQEKFGEKIGLARNTIANYECGRRELTNQVIVAICKEFNVNEKWLRTGEGERFVQVPEEDEIAALVFNFLKPDNKNDVFYQLILGIIEGYEKLDPVSQQTIRQSIKKYMKKEKANASP